MTRAASAPEPSHLWWLLAVLAAALAPHWGSFAAPWISDDTAALAYVHREGPWADWFQAQYGMRIVRFWRPLITTTLGLQESLTGVNPAPLRGMNLLGHAAAAILAGLLALRLGGRRRGALCAGVLAALFPDVGGTVTWIVGRVDSQTVPLILGAAWAATRAGRGAATAGAVLAFLAAASKELGFVAPLIGLALALGIAFGGACVERAGTARLAGLRAACARAAPLFLGAGLAFVWRRLAIGAWVGGYPAPSVGPAELWAAAALTARLFAWPLLALLLLVALARRGACVTGGARVVVGPFAALAAALLALGPLVPLLIDGALEPQNRRVLFLADALLAVALGAALGRVRERRWALVLGVLALSSLAVMRGLAARADVREWTAAAELAERHVARDRAMLVGQAPSADPVFDATFPRVYGGAYCLAWGAADRFRPPFEATPRPVWPLGLMFVVDGPIDRTRPRVTKPRDNLVWKFGEGQRIVPELVVSVGGRRDFGALELDLDVAAGGGAELEIWGTFPAGRVEALVYTELGYEAAALGPAQFGPPESDPDGTPSPVVRTSLGMVLRASEVASLGDALLQAADVGARRAYLELRIVDDEKGIRNRPLAASRMIPLTWAPDLPARLAEE